MADTRTKDGDTNKKKKKRDGKSPLSEAEQKALFEKYIVPKMINIKALAVKYTDKYQDAEDNYIHTLQQMFMYIHTYDNTRSLDTWIHIITKRACYHQNKKRAERNSNYADMSNCSSEILHQHGTANIVDAGFGTLADNISDTMYNALLSIEPYKLSAFLLYAQGMSIRNIARMEYRSGHMDKKSEELIRSRIFWARKELMYILKEHGYKSKSDESQDYDQQDYTDFDKQTV